jgi:hypothetical protein
MLEDGIADSRSSPGARTGARSGLAGVISITMADQVGFTQVGGGGHRGFSGIQV